MAVRKFDRSEIEYVSVVKREGAAAEAVRMHQEVVKLWRPFRALKQFLADQYPEEWEKVRRCGLTLPRMQEDVEDRRRVKLVPESCRRVPFCIRCVRNARVRRVSSAMDKFRRCTPDGEQPRFVHIVQNAPTWENRVGWGWQASERRDDFAKIVFSTLREFYGDGVGVEMSYQDFGERAFADRHPHMDLTLNGWRLGDEGAERTPMFDLGDGGHHRFVDRITERARATFGVEAERNRRAKEFDLTPVRIGVRQYWRILSYQMRELVDLRKLDYDRDENKVYWISEKYDTREPFKVIDFIHGMEEYQERLGCWKPMNQGGKSLHRAYGHLADRKLRETQRVMGGVDPEHGAKCPCGECNDWDRAFMDDVEAAVRGRPEALAEA